MAEVVGYRVYVEEITLDEDGDNKYRTVVDLSAPADVLVQFAPAAVSRTLGVTAPAPLPVHVAEAAPVPAPVAAPAAPVPAEEKPKRTRRSKGQIAADEAAKAAGAAAVTTSFEGASPVPPPSILDAPQVPDDLALPEPEVAPPAAAPFNPFAPR